MFYQFYQQKQRYRPMIQHPINPLQNLLKKDFRNTPTRVRPEAKNADNFSGTMLKGDYNSCGRDNGRSMSPNKLNATKKPFIGAEKKQGFSRNCGANQNNYQNLAKQRSPKSNKFKFNESCANHPEKNAQFFVSYDHEQLKYCQKCAINLASKGFQVSKIYKGVAYDQNLQFYSKPQFNYPQFASMPGYLQVKELADSVDITFSRFSDQLKKYSDIDNHYEFQYNITNQYYQNLLATIEQMREDHLHDLLQQQKKHSQMAYIQLNNISQDIQTLETIRNDLTQNLELILDQFGEHKTKQNLNYYREQILINYQQKIEEHENFFKEVINYKESNLSAMLKKAQNFLLEIWEEYDNNPKQQHSKQQQKNLNIIRKDEQKKAQFIKEPLFNQNQPKEKTACRKLFQDSIEQLIGEVSPQFKNI